MICAGCFIHVPLPGGVPIALQDMLAMLSGLLLGPFFGSLAVLIFLLLGAVGLPVFTGKAGVHVLVAGPTSGFLWGYLAAAFVGGTILAFGRELIIFDEPFANRLIVLDKGKIRFDGSPSAGLKFNLEECGIKNPLNSYKTLEDLQW